MTYPSFSAGDVLAASDMNAVGLWLIDTRTATSGAALDVTDVFTSTYDNYRIIIQEARATATVGWSLELLPTAATGYYYSGLYVDMTPTITGVRGNHVGNFDLGVVTTVSAGAVIDVITPNINTATYVHINGTDPRAAAPYRPVSGWRSAQAQTGFKIAVAGTISNLVVKTYGYRK